MKVATIVLRGISPMTQSQDINHIPRNSGEAPDAFDSRVWRQKAYQKDDVVHVKAFALQSCIIDGAKHAKEKIHGKGNSTWGKKFESGIMVEDDVSLNVRVEDLIERPVFVHANGVRGSGSRVTRRFPEISKGWSATAKVFILDDEITKEIFDKSLQRAGMFVGLGQFRPQNRGTNGRFRAEIVDWQESVEF